MTKTSFRASQAEIAGLAAPPHLYRPETSESMHKITRNRVWIPCDLVNERLNRPHKPTFGGQGTDWSPFNQSVIMIVVGAIIVKMPLGRLHFKQLHIEHERGIRGDHAAGTTSTIAQGCRNLKLTGLADLH